MMEVLSFFINTFTAVSISSEQAMYNSDGIHQSTGTAKKAIVASAADKNAFLSSFYISALTWSTLFASVARR